jgi:hypothetical protein
MQALIGAVIEAIMLLVAGGLLMRRETLHTGPGAFAAMLTAGNEGGIESTRTAHTLLRSRSGAPTGLYLSAKPKRHVAF